MQILKTHHKTHLDDQPDHDEGRLRTWISKKDAYNNIDDLHSTTRHFVCEEVPEVELDTVGLDDALDGGDGNVSGPVEEYILV